MAMKTAVQSLEEQYAEKAATAMAREIDREVLWGMLVGIGWTRVLLDRLQDNKHAVDITYWLEANCKEPFERNGRDFLFESEQDAVNFILRWQ
jgi:hypothetical protein